MDGIPKGLPRAGINVQGLGHSILLPSFLIPLYRLSLVKVTTTFYHLLPIPLAQY